MSKHCLVLPQFIFIILLSCFITCKPKEDQVEITYLWHDTAVIEEHSYLKDDTLKHGTWRYYYHNKPKRILQEEIPYKYGKIDGWNTHYREDGTMEYKTYFKNDKRDGSAIWYYSNGAVKTEGGFREDKKYGAFKFYYPNGSPEAFSIYDFIEETMYVINWDTIGTKINEEGVVLSSDYIIVYEDDVTESPIYDKTIKSGKPFLMKLTVAQTPETKTVVTMQDLTENQLVPAAVFENYTITYKQTLTKPGIHSYKVKGEMYGLEHNNLLRQDSVVVNIEVVNK